MAPSSSSSGFALALRLACILCVVMVHCQDDPSTEAAPGADDNAADADKSSGADVNAAVGSTGTERAHNIGILIGIIFGSVAVNIVTVFLIVYCLRGKGGGGGASERRASEAPAMSKRRSSERKSTYDELKDDYELGEARASERKSSARGSQRLSATSVLDEEDARRSSARVTGYADEDEISSPGDEKKSSIFSRLSGSIKDRLSGEEARRSSARMSGERSSARISGERSSARMSQRASAYDEEGGERRSSARGSAMDEGRRSSGGERRSSGGERRSSGGERRSSAKGGSFAEGEEGEERRSSQRRSSFK